jgi:hypothetical protein
MVEQNELRQRKKNRNSKKKSKDDKTKEEKAKSGKKQPAPDATDKDAEFEKESLVQTFLRHPLVKVTPFILIPYAMYNFLHFIHLKRPDIVTDGTFGLIPMRPAIKSLEERQVLIIGSEVVENRNIVAGLQDSLKLEVVNEAFDAENYFCRDVSVSWFQIIRFLQPLESSTEDDEFVQYSTMKMWDELCLNRTDAIVSIFHPRNYRETNCSAYSRWSNCWARECLGVVNSQWGCAWNDSCEPSFARVLHQVRHPIRTIERLNSTFCPNEQWREPFLDLVSAWFPKRDWFVLSCLESMAWYVADFHNTLLKARDAGLIHGIFQIERTSPCEVASQAGFLAPLYEPNSEKISNLCHSDEGGNTGSKAALSSDAFSDTKAKSDDKKMALEDFHGGKHHSKRDAGDTSLADVLKELVSKLGYDGEANSEFL